MKNFLEKKQAKSNPSLTTQIYNLVILDKSGSMESIANAAIQGFNETVAGIRVAQEKFKDTQEHFLSLMIFCDCEKKMVYKNTPIAEVKDLTSKDYQPCCCTPLYDAMGISLITLYNTIHKKENATAVVTVITDGMENSSRKYSGREIKALVEKLTQEEGWQFSYIGTNQDVEEVADGLSIKSTISFEYSNEGMGSAWQSERNAKMRYYDSLNRMNDRFDSMSVEERKRERANLNANTKFFMDEKDFQDRITPQYISHLAENEVFVFGSDVTGSHLGGLAKFAVEHFGAQPGCAEGMQGQCYAIPTTGLPFQEIEMAIERFIVFAEQHPELRFLVTPIGCGNAGYSASQMASQFIFAAKFPNICLPEEFWKFVR